MWCFIRDYSVDLDVSVDSVELNPSEFISSIQVYNARRYGNKFHSDPYGKKESDTWKCSVAETIFASSDC